MADISLELRRGGGRYEGGNTGKTLIEAIEKHMTYAIGTDRNLTEIELFVGGNLNIYIYVCRKRKL